MESLDPAPHSDSSRPVRAVSERGRARAWVIAFLACPAGATWLAATGEASATAVFASAATVVLILGFLLWRWQREQSSRSSPWSEYVAVAYVAVFYVPALMMLDEIGDRLIDWLLFVPPVSVLAWLLRLAMTASTAQALQGRRRARRVHQAAMTVFLVAAGFLMLSIIAIVITPIPLTGAALHFHAARFYGE